MIRRFRLEDARPARDVKVAAVKIAASGRCSAAELADRVSDPAMPEGWDLWLDSPVTFVDEATRKIAGLEGLDPAQMPNVNPVKRVMEMDPV